MLMLPSTKKKNLGFSLIEVLVAAAIFSGLSILGTQLLWDTLTSRAKQTSIEETADNVRLVVSTITKAIQSAKSVSVPDSVTLQITGEPCRTVKFNPTDKSIEEATDATSPSCTPPSNGFTRITKGEVVIQNLEFSPTGNLVQSVTIKVGGIYKDTLGEHPINFETTVASRIAL